MSHQSSLRRSPPPPHSSVSATHKLSLAALCNHEEVSPIMASTGPSTSSSSCAGSSSGSSNSKADNPRLSRGQLSLNTDDESVMIAVRALDDMRSGAAAHTSNRPAHPCASTSPLQTPALTATSTVTSPSVESPNFSLSLEDSAAAADFVSRVSEMPLVNSALRAYEQSKASSRVVKYGAEMMESSVKTISKPVIDRLPVNQLDEFACRQLDRIGGRRTASHEAKDDNQKSETSHKRERHSSDEESEKIRSQATFSTGDQDTRSRDVATRETSATTQVVSRSRWHNILYEASGIGAAVSEESMRRLKYCLQWLQFAAEHIDGQILVLRNFIASLNSRMEHGSGDRYISASHMQTLTNVKRDVINTIRQVVDVVSKYAGGALPEPARIRVRQFVLHLPQRWAANSQLQAQSATQQSHSSSQNANSGKRRRRTEYLDGSCPTSAASTAPSSPLHSPLSVTRPELPAPATHRQAPLARPTNGSAAQAAHRVLTLATESLDMMRSVTGVVRESLDRADVWVDRLRVIGVQRQQSSDIAVDGFPRRENQSASLSRSETMSDSIASSSCTSAAYPSYPPSPYPYTRDGHSPGGLAAASASLGALTLDSLSASASAIATPRSSSQSLQSLAGYDWDYTSRKLPPYRRTSESKPLLEEGEDRKDRDEERDEDEEREEACVHGTERRSVTTALSAMRSATRNTRFAAMEIDND